MVKRMLRSAVFAVLRFSGLPYLMREVWARDKVTIVVYHDLAADRAAVHFEALRRRYNIIPLSEYLSARAGGSARLPARALIITFDDGHRGNYELLALLERDKVPVTIFLCSEIVDTRRHYWWYHARDAAEAAALKALPDEQRVEALQGRGHCDTREYETRQALTRAEIEALRGLVDFQSHTIFHPILPACTGERAAREIAESKEVLENRYGLRICALAYPNGDYSDRETRLLRESGYTCGLTLDPGFNDLETDLFRLRRVALPDDAGVNELLVKASGLWELLKGTRRLSLRQARWASAAPDGQGNVPAVASDGSSV